MNKHIVIKKVKYKKNFIDVSNDKDVQRVAKYIRNQNKDKK